MFRRRQSRESVSPEAMGAVATSPNLGESVDALTRSPTVGSHAAAGAPAERDAEALQDERLMRAAQRGELAAFNALVVRHERAVFNVCLRMLRDVPSAEDAAQDAFVQAGRGAGDYRGGLVRPWLLRIATNRCYDLLRSKARRPAGSLDAEPFEVEPVWTSQSAAAERPEAFALRGELAVHLERALAALPEDQRLVVVLSDVQGCDYEEIARITGTALGTVKSRLSRARARLRQALHDDPTAGELFERYGRFYEGRDGPDDDAPSGR